ncbi:sensor histidine kinase [Thermoactinospora rubra]|uniref:sensor histidine kinase n=1 Tax=Thermoactinospora rubra TaxID=1088767 RepID=UPI000A121446|nr:histidine kinase [Thermoactinospora rubra]
MISAVARPFKLALFTGRAGPPQHSFLRFPMPRWLGLLPFRGLDVTLVADVAIAFFVYATSLSYLLGENDKRPLSSGMGMIYLTALAFSVPIAMRHRWPLAAWRVLMLGTLATLVVQAELRSAGTPLFLPGTVVAGALCLYAVAVRCDRDATLGAWVVSVGFVWLVDQHEYSLLFGAIIPTVAVLFGHNVRVRRSATARLAEEKERTEIAEAAQAVLEERARIARELHDVVAHHMSVIAIQAEAVPLEAAGDPRRLEAGLATIRSLSLEAIAELRQILGVLRDGEGRVETAPLPGLERLEDLLANARAAGLEVELRRSGPVEDVPQAVGLSAYRILQESLSNVMRHAPGARVRVELEREEEALRLRVINSVGLPQDAAVRRSGGGQGLLGMRERAAAHGGSLRAEVLPGGGFEVAAVLPLEAA